MYVCMYYKRCVDDSVSTSAIASTGQSGGY